MTNEELSTIIPSEVARLLSSRATARSKIPRGADLCPLIVVDRDFSPLRLGFEMTMMHMEIKKIFKIVEELSNISKTPAYVVGGFVRDLLLGNDAKKDLDFVVEGSGLAFAKAFDDEMTKGLPRRSPIGAKAGSLVEFPDFDTARYVIGEGDEQLIIEFAGARSEVYDEKSRKPKVTATTLEQDLARRDFTVNAMAIRVSELKDLTSLLSLSLKGEKVIAKPHLLRRGQEEVIIDPFNGQKDLKEKILRTPLDPDVTFSEDPLRMLRAVRFAAQLNFSIDKQALESIHRNRERIKIVSGERIQEELLKLMSAKQPSVGLILMFQTGLMDVILPEVSALDGIEDVYGHQHKNNLVHSFKVVDNIAEWALNPWLRLTGLLHDIGKPKTKLFVPKVGWTFHAHEHLGKKMSYGIAKRLRFSKERTDYVAKLIRWHLQPIALMDEGITDSAVRRLVVEMGDLLDDLLILGRGDITTGNPYKKEKRLKNYDRLKDKIAEVLEKDKLRAFQSPFRGDEIMAATGLKPGPTVGKIKSAIEEAILDGKIPNEYDAAKRYFTEIKEDFLKQAQNWELLS